MSSSSTKPPLPPPLISISISISITKPYLTTTTRLTTSASPLWYLSSRSVIHARKSAVSSTSLKWTLVIISSLAISVAGFLFGITAILHRDEGGVNRCAGGRPRSVRVVWDQHGNDDDFTVMGLELSQQRSQFRLSLQLDGSIDLIIKTERIDGA
ncbi:hypothetical protein ACFE04_019978 [Oxalis oulophora]